MSLKDYIRTGVLPPPATATFATVATHERPHVPTVAIVATVAVATPPNPEPEQWADLMRGVAVAGLQLDLAAAVLDSLMGAGTIERALILGWDARELIGLQRARPHDHPARAGLVYSMSPGDAVSDIRDTGCAIAIAGTNVRHIWRRAPLPSDGSLIMPWQFASAAPPFHPPTDQ